MTRTLAKQDGFLPAMKGCQMENSRTQPPPFHIASLLSPSPPSSDREKKASGDVSATVHYLPAEGSRDVNALSGSAELPTSCVYTGSLNGSSGVLQQPPFLPLTPSLPPHPTYYPPSTFHFHYQLPSEFSPLLPPPVGAPDKNPSPPLPPQSQSRYRTTYSSEQLHTLESIFSEKKYVSSRDRLLISREIGVSEKQIKMWFQNRRTRMRKEASQVKRKSPEQ